MPADTVTLILSGEVSLESFARAIQRFSELVRGLSIDKGAPDLDWLVADLQLSSAVATAVGRGEEEKVARVVRAYEEVGAALEQGGRIPYSAPVRAAAEGLRSIPGRQVESITFETSEREAIIRPQPQRPPGVAEPGWPARLAPPVPVARVAAYGAVEGRVQTLSSRGGLRFTLYDLLHDKAVSCYLAEGAEEIMRDAWGEFATVEGLVTRDPLTGRPLAVRQVTRVTIQSEIERSYRDARGAAPSLTGLSPEDAIRRVRDA
jgi:hypothetical protein